jgi:hypothetical protein
MEYKKAQPMKLRDVGKDERWLQDRINEDTSILGLGDLTIIKRERPQYMGGRLDFLMFDPEDWVRYEIEIMLGTLDESHIIRTIEYWDIERRRYPGLEHRAVIVAEDITNRFFNIIALMNKAIPIIAVQLNAFTYEHQLFLNFVKVLDLAEPPEEEDAETQPDVNREYWVARSHPMSMQLADSLIDVIGTIAEPRLTYNKGHMALGTKGKNFLWFYPRKSQHIRIRLRVGEEREAIATRLEEQGIECTKGTHPEMIRLPLTRKEFEENRDLIKEILSTAESRSH